MTNLAFRTPITTDGNHSTIKRAGMAPPVGIFKVISGGQSIIRQARITGAKERHGSATNPAIEATTCVAGLHPALPPPKLLLERSIVKKISRSMPSVVVPQNATLFN
jgi:hypothetical protein